MRDRGIPTPGLLRVQRDRVQGARRRPGAAGDRAAAPVPDRRQARRARARRSGSSSRARAAGRPAARWWRRSRTTARCCSSATSRGATWRSRCIDEDGEPRALPIVEAVPRAGGLLRLRGALRDRPHHVRLPGRARRRARPRAPASSRSSVYELLGCSGFARVDLMLDSIDGRAVRARGQRDPRADRDEPAAPGRRRGRDRASTSWSSGSWTAATRRRVGAAPDAAAPSLARVTRSRPRSPRA